MATVEVRSLAKHFDGDVHAVDGVDFATTEGEFLVLLGPSGCGKTTLLRMIAGLETPTSGSILIGGRDVADLPLNFNAGFGLIPTARALRGEWGSRRGRRARGT